MSSFTASLCVVLAVQWTVWWSDSRVKATTTAAFWPVSWRMRRAILLHSGVRSPMSDVFIFKGVFVIVS